MVGGCNSVTVQIKVCHRHFETKKGSAVADPAFAALEIIIPYWFLGVLPDAYRSTERLH